MLFVAGGFLVLASIAYAIVGLQNPSFEDGLNGWEVHSERGHDSNREIVYGNGGVKGPAVPCDGSSYGICVTGTDTFQYYLNGDDDPNQTASETVTPPVGSKMLRLDGPFPSYYAQQRRHRMVVQQQFTVDSANPVLKLYYNLYSFDSPNYDLVELRANLIDENGALIASEQHAPVGGGGSLNTTGWLQRSIDLSAYVGQQVNLRITLAGTRDRQVPSWAYVDADLATTPPPSGPAPDTAAPETTITKKPKKALKAKGKKKAKASFSFTSTEPGSSFQCKLDKGGWKGCSSPVKVSACGLPHLPGAGDRRRGQRGRDPGQGQLQGQGREEQEEEVTTCGWTV